MLARDPPATKATVQLCLIDTPHQHSEEMGHPNAHWDLLDSLDSGLGAFKGAPLYGLWPKVLWLSHKPGGLWGQVA